MKNLMKVVNRRLYRIENNQARIDMIKPGFEIDIDSISAFGTSYVKEKTFCAWQDGKVIDFLDEIDLATLDSKKKKQLLSMLEGLKYGFKNYKIGTREILLEQIRRDAFEDVPSRQDSLFLSDKKSLPYWIEQVYHDGISHIYKVECTGTLFKSSDYSLPYGTLPIPREIDDCYRYWLNDQTNCKKQPRNEYLFKGHLKVLEEVDKEIVLKKR